MNIKQSTSDELIAALEIHRHQVQMLKTELAKRKRICGRAHKYVSDTPVDASDEWFTSECHCSVCGSRGKYYFCAKSPNGMCKYDVKNDPMLDDCIYCGLPDERK